VSIFFPIQGAELPNSAPVDAHGEATLAGSGGLAAEGTVTWPPPVHGEVTLAGAATMAAVGTVTQAPGTVVFAGRSTFSAGESVVVAPQPRVNFDVTTGGGISIVVDAYNAVFERLAAA